MSSVSKGWWLMLVVAMSRPALAEDIAYGHGWDTLSAGFGLSHMQDSISGFPNDPDPKRPPYDFVYKDGAAFGLGVDYRIDARWHLGPELTVTRNDVESSDPPPSSLTGTLKVSLLTVNLYCDLLELSSERWKPYVGLGWGAARVELDDYVQDGQPVISNRSAAAAVQFIAGVRYLMGEHWQAHLEYRGVSTDDPMLATVNGNTMQTSVHAHLLMAGVDWRF